ncbi:MAG: hypothetical protein IPI33_06975 [Dehalococcoidia bacterium]|nr:hypothetical protein [Dehalococcoidia bacterium]
MDIVTILTVGAIARVLARPGAVAAARPPSNEPTMSVSRRSQPGEPPGPAHRRRSRSAGALPRGLTTARVLSSAAIVGMFAYLGARGDADFLSVVGFGLLGGVYVAFIQMTVGLVVARSPELAALQLSGVARAASYVFAAPAFVLGLPSRVVARSIITVSRDPDTDILTLVEREAAGAWRNRNGG